MGHKDTEETCSDDIKHHCSHSKIRYKEKEQVISGCQCAQYLDPPFSYTNLPPPGSPPDGRADLWDLQFCRWWGWNWVRKRESIKGSVSKSEPINKPCLSSKCRDSSGEYSSSKHKSTTKKTSFSCKDIESRSPPTCTSLQPLTYKQQFKAMCKCLLGKKNTPSCMLKLYNTPSTSTTAVRQDRGSHERKCHQRKKSSSRDKSNEKPSCKGKSRKPPIPSDEDSLSPPLSEQSVIINNIPCDSIYTHRHESSTEESVEYLTVKFHANGDSECDCQKTSPSPKLQMKNQSIAVGTNSEKTDLDVRLDVETDSKIITKKCNNNKDDKETQTHKAVETEVDSSSKNFEPSSNICPCSEKLLKLKGKRHKTICIKVCCCGSCKPNREMSQKSNEKSANVYGTQVPERSKEFFKEDHSTMKPERDGVCSDVTCKLRKDATNLATFDDFTTYPLTTLSLSNKMLSKFGVPSKKYPWMESTESAETTTSLNNIGHYTSSLSDIYELFDSGFDKNASNPGLKLPDINDFNDNLSYLKILDSPRQTKVEDRILLEAVCDAILSNHEDKTNMFLEELQLNTNRYNFGNTKDLGILCNFNTNDTSKTDVYTDLSRVLVDTEEIGIQLSKISDLNTIFENTGINRLDTMISSIIDNLSESRANISRNEYSVQKESDLSTELHESKSLNTSFPRPELLTLPEHTSVLRTPIKRSTTASAKENDCKKKLKQEDDTYLQNFPVGNKASDNIEHVFSSIEDIVHRSKVKTAELHSMSNSIPKKQELLYIDSENLLDMASVSQNETKLGINLSNTENTLRPEQSKLTLKRNYPMSSDMFKGSIYEAFKKNYINKNNISDQDSKSCNILSESILKDHNLHDVSSKINNKEGVNTNADNSNLVNQNISKLSVQCFLVCDEKSKVHLQSPATINSRTKLDTKLVKKKKSNISYIPVKKRGTPDD